MIWLVLPAILAASQADHALAQERIDTSNFSAAAKAELSREPRLSIVKCSFIRNTTGQAASLKEPSPRPVGHVS